MKLPAPADWLFSVKLFTAAMIAYWLSAAMGLPQSYWSVVTCCVVLNPLSGAVRSKALYRIVGTVCGGLSVLIITAAFASVPWLIIAVSGLAVATVFGIAVLDRTPRGYVFQLWGITLIIIVTTNAAHPEHIFDTAVARMCEIGVGILCATVVDSIIAPRSLAPQLRQRLSVWLTDMAAWIDDVRAGRGRDAATATDRQRMLTDLTAMSALAVQLRHDPSVGTWLRQSAFAIQDRLLRLTPKLSAVEAHMERLSPVRQAELLAHLAVTDEVTDRHPRPLLFSETDDDTHNRWQRLVEESLAAQMQDVQRLWAEASAIAAAVDAPRSLTPSLAAQVERSRAFPLQPDAYMARRVAAGLALVYGLLAGLWWLTGWAQGGNALMLSVLALGFFGGSDEAGKALGMFARLNLLAAGVAIVLAYGLLPLAQDFPSFALAMGLVMLPVAARAATNPLAILILATVFSTINLQTAYTVWDFNVYVDGVCATLVGIGMSYLCITAIRRMGPAHTRRRFAQMERREVMAFCRRADPAATSAYSNRALDRVAGMVVRVPAGEREDTSRWLLAWMRTGVAVGTVRHLSSRLSGEMRPACEALLAQIRADLAQARGASAALIDRIDHLLGLADATRHVPRSFVRSLVELRLGVTEGAPAWGRPL